MRNNVHRKISKYSGETAQRVASDNVYVMSTSEICKEVYCLVFMCAVMCVFDHFMSERNICSFFFFIFSTVVPCILILSQSFIYQLMHNRVALKEY